MNADRSLLDVEVGDRIVIDPATYSRTPQPLVMGTVTDVRRKYLTVKWCRDDSHRRWFHDTDFSRETGKQRVENGYSNYLDDAYTIDGWAVQCRRRRAEFRCQALRRDHGSIWNGLTVDQLERIADIYEEGR